MNTHQLDRAICERLGIEPANRWVVGNEDSSCYSGSYAQCQKFLDDHQQYCISRGYLVWTRLVYPALSTTADGMLTLMNALLSNQIGWTMSGDKDGVKSWAGNRVFTETTNASAPLSLALAVVDALGIEVPE